MVVSDSSPTRVLSFLNGDPDLLFQQNLTPIRWSFCPSPQKLRSIGDVFENGFVTLLAREHADIALIPLCQDDLALLEDMLASSQRYQRYAGGLWGRMPVALVAVLDRPDITVALQAAQLEFDGVAAPPFAPDILDTCLGLARQRCRRRGYQNRRHATLRQLCRNLNRRRRHLQAKIDLLCRDLISGNLELTGSLRDLKRAYDFQCHLSGEFDLAFLLCRAIREIKDEIAEANAAIYLAATSDFEAHITGAWYDDAADLHELENTIKAAVIPKVLQSRRPVRIERAENFNDFAAKHRRALAGLSLMALPVATPDELIGVFVLYRSADKPLTDADKALVQPFLAPLAQAILTTQRIDYYVHSPRS